MADGHRIRALSLIATALVATLAMAACTAILPARDPKHGELVGTWKNGRTELTIPDSDHFTVKNLSSERVFSEEGRNIELNVSGKYAIDDKDRLENLRALTFGYTPVGGSNSGGILQAAFDPTTNPVSIVILGGSVDDPKYFHLYKTD